MFKSAMLFLLLASALFCAQTTFTVKEHMGVSRTNEPVSGGIAFSKGASPSVSQLALFDGGTEVPAQFYPLVTNLDGSVQWVLVDFTTDLGANAEKSYTLRTQSPSAQASQKISVSRSGSVITINNGVLSFSFDTVSFKGIESLVHGSKTLIFGPGGISALDLVKGDPDTNGSVTAARFIYLGDLRATYRVEGELYRGACGGLGYAYTMTTYAGSPRVVIEATIRNSINASCGRLAKISRAFAGFNLGFDPARTVSYDTLAGHPNYMYSFQMDTIRSTRAFEDASGSGLAVTEKWGGGAYENFLNRTTLSGRKLEVEIIQPITDTMSYGTRPRSFYAYVADSASKAATGTEYVYYLMDYAHKNSQIVLECYDGSLTAPGLRSRMLAGKHRLIPKQAPADVAASGGLSIGQFGTLEDEQAYQTGQGWQTDSPFPTGDAYYNDHKIQRMRGGRARIGKPDCAPWMDIEAHYDIEMDYLQGWFVQWVRYNDRDYFDLAEAFGKYYDNYFTFRTVGFEWDGQDSYVRGNSTRTTEAVPHPGVYDGTIYGALVTTRVDINTWGGCHFFLTGMTDYYCLTGDPDALDACKDVNEVVEVYLDEFGGNRGPVDTSNSNIDLGDRGVNRKLNYWIRYYEITKDPQVLVKLQKYMRGAMKSHKVDPYFWQKSPFYEASWHATPFAQYKVADTLLQYLRTNRLGIQQLKDNDHFDQYIMHDSIAGTTWPLYAHPGWMSFWLVDALENWLRVFPGDDDVRDYVIGFANYVTAIKDGYCGLDNYEGVLSDFPRPGMHSPTYHIDGDTLCLIKWDPQHAECATRPRASDTLGLHSSWNNALVLAVQAAGFRNTGSTRFLKQAEHIWGYVSGNYPIPGPADQKAKYALIGEWEFYHNDQLTKVAPLFYEKIYHTDTVPPEAVNDLSVTRTAGKDGLIFSWNAPAGNAVSYQLKYFKEKPLVDYPDYDYSAIDTTKCPWWYGVNVAGEPVPGGAGSPEGYTLAGDFPEDSVFYAALCSRDAAGNLSRLSNPVRIDNTISVEAWDPEGARFALCAFPNPFNPVVTLRVNLPKEGIQPVVSVFDAAGRLVWKAQPSATGKKMVNVAWHGKNMAGTPVGSGVYFVKLTCAGKEINKKIVMVR